jgi:hypothetical protein
VLRRPAAPPRAPFLRLGPRATPRSRDLPLPRVVRPRAPRPGGKGILPVAMADDAPPHGGSASAPGGVPAAPLVLARPSGPPRPAPHAPLPHAPPGHRFARAARARDRAEPWYGLGWLWRHRWHLLASAGARADIDARDWMRADPPHALAARIAAVLQADGRAAAASLTERLDRDLVIDYVSDTGDDVAVSRAVAAIVARPWEIGEDGTPPERVPRGDLLVFGGDAAYPVATYAALRQRLVEPWNEALRAFDDGRARALLGVPGNHDWNDGLDGFARLFRRAVDAAAPVTASTGHGRLALHGYTAVQSATYFALPLAPGLDLRAGDRQLDKVDFRQRAYFAAWHAEVAAHTRAHIVVQADPLRAFDAPSPAGHATRAALAVDHAGDRDLVISGDSHHYQRWHPEAGPGGAETTHVIAGGGGAALHPVPLDAAAARARGLPPGERKAVEWPSAAACRALLWEAPLRLLTFRAGLLVHAGVGAAVLLLGGLGAALGALAAALLGRSSGPALRSSAGPAFEAVASSAAPHHLGPAVLDPGALDPGALGAAAGLLALAGVLVAALPRLASPRDDAGARAARGLGALTALGVLLATALPYLAVLAASAAPEPSARDTALALAAASGALVAPGLFGLYAAALTLRGLDHTLAFATLAHPGYKHVLRLRVARDGRHVDAFVAAVVDPAGDPDAPTSRPFLLDTFRWTARD